MRLTTAFLFCLAGCFSQPSAPDIKCDADNPCAAGFFCDNNSCQPIASDMADTGGVDGSMASGCRSGQGTAIGTAWACPGTCAAGTCGSLCADTWSICKKADGIDMVAASSLGGFFVGDVPGYYFPPTRVDTSCGANVATAAPIVFGVGKNQQYVTENAAKNCAGFTKSADCGASPRIVGCSAPWNASTMTIHAAQNGVICCK